MTDAPIRVTLNWSEPLLRELLTVAQRRKGGPRMSPTMQNALSLGAGVVLGVLIVGGLVFTKTKPPRELLWVMMPLLAVLVAWQLIYGRTVRRWIKGELSSPIRKGPSDVVLSAEGIKTTHPVMDSQIKWPAVFDLRDAPLALHIMLSGNVSLPVPDAALPDGLSRVDLRQRIEGWIGR